MIYEKRKKLNEAKLYRHTGIHIKEFNKYVQYLKYWKEYPNFSQMNIIYNISESSCFHNVNWVENNLIKTLILNSQKNYPKKEKGVLSNLLMLQK